MRQITDYCTKSLLPLALVCSFLFAGCQGPLTDEELKMALLNSGDKGVGMTLLNEEEEGVSSEAKALVGTWLEMAPVGYGSWYIGGWIFNADGTIRVLDELYDDKGNNSHDRNIPIGPIADSGPTDAQLQILVNAVKAEPTLDTWSVSGNIITLTEPRTSKSDDFEIDIDTWKYVLNGSTLMLYCEYDGDRYGATDADGDGYEDEPEWILTKYNF